MTVEVYSSPGTSAWESTRFTATVNGSTAYVYGYSRTAIMDTSVWNDGDAVECSWLTFGADVTATVAITRLAGAVTSAVIYPNDDSVTQTIASGVLSLSVPTNRRYRIEINGDRKHVFYLFASPLKVAVPGTTTNWTAVAKPTISGIVIGTGVITTSSAHGLANDQPCRIWTNGSYPVPASGAAITNNDVLYATVLSPTTLTVARTVGGATMTYSSAGASNGIQRADWTSTTNALYFGAGVHYPGMLFRPANNTTIYIDGGAVLVGSFDLRDRDGVTIEGPGVLSGTFATPETVAGLASADKDDYSMFFGYDGANWTFDNSVQGITVVNTPYYTTFYGVWSFRNVHIISPWYWNSDGFDCAPRSSGTPTGEIVDCFAHTGDDCARLMNNDVITTMSGTFCVAVQGACVLFSYWGTYPSDSRSTTVSDCHGMHIGLVDTDANAAYPIQGGNPIFKCWIDTNDTTQTTYGRFYVDVADYYVWGPMASRLFSFENKTYPFGDTLIRDQFGRCAFWTFDGLTVEETPGQVSRLYGSDWINTPHDISFDNVTIDDVALTVRNWSDFVTQNAYPYNITVGGFPVVTTVELVNIALSHIGEGITVTSIAPPDDTAQAIAASRFLTMAITQTLGSYAWPFATTRAALVEASDNDRDDVFGYCYELPTDCVRVLGVVPEGTKDHYLLADNSPIPYQAEVSDDGTQRIYTDLEDAQIRYTKYVDDPNKWTTQFQYAFTWMMASLLAGATLKDTKLSDTLLQRAFAFIGSAARDASTRREARPAHNPPWFSSNPRLPDARIVRP